MTILSLCFFYYATTLACCLGISLVLGGIAALWLRLTAEPEIPVARVVRK